MELGAWILIFGLAAVYLISRTPDDWLKALGGALIAATVLFIVMDVVTLIAR